MKPYTFALGANQIIDPVLGGEYFLLDVAPSPVKFEFFGAGNLRREETLEDARYFLFGDDEVMDGESFIQGNFSAAQAGLITSHQLFNAAGSGKILFLDKVWVSPITATTQLVLKQHNAAIGVSSGLGVNKNLGGAAGVGDFRMGTGVAGTNVTRGIFPLNAFTPIPLRPGMRIPEGRGVHIEDTTVNQGLLSGWQWREKLS